MVQNTYRANLTAAEFPFLSEFQGRNIIVPTIDQNYSRQANSPKNKDRDIGIPQCYYMHNVMPTDAGLISVGIKSIVNAPADTDNFFQDIFTLRDPNERVAYFNNTGTGYNYILTNLSAGWVRTTDLAPLGVGLVTVAHVNGQSYIYFSNLGCYKYNFSTNTLDSVTLTALTAADVIGITASSGYLIVWTNTKVFWSSLVDPTDFTPSLVTGAGSESLQQAKSVLTICLPQNNGFIAYTKKNAIALIYTGNSQYPFSAKEIIGAGGLDKRYLAACDGNSTNHFSYTTAGLQEVSINSSNIVFPQLTDFVAGSSFEDFNENTLTFFQVDILTPMKKRLTLIANRYLVFSYGVTQLTHALVYDFALARWGKLKVNHVDCFEYSYPSYVISDIPKQSIGFVQTDGTVLVCTISYSDINSYGVVILGKYQFDRNHYIGIQEIHLNSIRKDSNVKVNVLSTIDGENVYTTESAYLSESTNKYRRYDCRSVGLNHSLVVSGAFHLNSLVFKFTDEGEVR